MKCPTCGKCLPDTARYCDNCATAMDRCHDDLRRGEDFGCDHRALDAQPRSFAPGKKAKTKRKKLPRLTWALLLFILYILFSLFSNIADNFERTGAEPAEYEITIPSEYYEITTPGEYKGKTK